MQGTVFFVARSSRGQGGQTMKRLGIGQIIVLAALIIILIMTAVWATSVWNAGGESVMDKHGWIALGLGTFFSLLIGCGLMALMFFSRRSGYDEVADPFRKRELTMPKENDLEGPQDQGGKHGGQAGMPKPEQPPPDRKNDQRKPTHGKVVGDPKVAKNSRAG